MSDELMLLLAEKREIEQRIMALTSGAVARGPAKIDRIGCSGKFQKDKWALFYKYDYVANTGGCHGVPKERSRWNAIVNGDTKDQVILQMPGVINALTELYEAAKGEEHGTDT